MKEIHLRRGPFIQTNNRARNILRNIFISLIPLIIFSFYKNGIVLYGEEKNVLVLLMPIIVLLICGISSFITDFIISKIKKENKTFSFFVKNKHSFLPGIILALLLPIDLPLYLYALGGILSSIVGRITYAGISLFNKVALSYLVVILIYALAIANINLFQPIDVTSGSLWSMFFGSTSLIVTNSFLCLLGFIFLIYKKAIKWKIPVTYILTVFVMTYIIGILNNQVLYYPVYHLLSGGLVFASIYLASDNETSPTTLFGQVTYAIFLGLLTVIFRFYISDALSIIFSILIMNLFNIIIDELGSLSRFGLRKGSVLVLVQIILVLGISLYIAETTKIEVSDSVVINEKI